MALVRARSSGATLLRWGGTRSARTGGPARHASALTRHDSCMGTIEHEAEYLAHNYHPLPVVLEKGAAAPAEWRVRVKHA